MIIFSARSIDLFMASTLGSPPDPIYVLYGFTDGVSSISFVDFDQCHYLLTGDSSGECGLWDLNTMKSVWRHRVEKSILSCGRWSRGIWAHARGQFVRFWTMTDGNSIPADCGTIPCPNIGFCNATVLVTKINNEITDLIAIPTDKDAQYGLDIYRSNGTNQFSIFTAISLNNASGSKLGIPMTAHLAMEKSDSALLMVGFDSGTLGIWRLDQSKSIVLAELNLLQEAVWNLDYSASRRFGVCVSPENVINCWRFDDQCSNCDRIERIEDIRLPNGRSCNCVRIRPDAKLFAVGCSDGKIRVFSAKTLKPLAVLKFHNESIRCLAFADVKINGRRLMAAGSSDGLLSLWNLYND